MTCVFDQTKALCQIRSAEGDPRVTPDQDDCRRDCHNIAYTDRDIDHLRVQAAGIGEILDNSLAPSPPPPTGTSRSRTPATDHQQLRRF
jgi:hypothetical protein